MHKPVALRRNAAPESDDSDSFSGCGLIGGELAELAAFAVPISRAFVRALADARLGEIEVVDLGADATKNFAVHFGGTKRRSSRVA